MAAMMKRKSRHYSKKERTSKRTKRGRPSPDWAELPFELLQEILGRLTFVDQARAQWSCRRWRAAASGSRVNPTPWLWIPPQAEEPDGIKRENSSHARLYNPADDYLHTTKASSEENRATFCVGASQGYLVFLDYSVDPDSPYFIPYLFNPLTGSRRQLPKIDPTLFKLPRVNQILKLGTRITTGTVRECVVHKAILTSDPNDCESRSRFTVVLLCDDEHSRRISICAPFSDYSWTELDGAFSAPYLDVSTSDGFLFALGGNYSVEVWSIRHEDSDFPYKLMSFAPSVPELFPIGETDCCVSRFYMVKPDGGGDDAMPILVARIVGDYVDGEGKVVGYDEMVPEEEGSNHPPVCPYRTVGFEVYKMDTDRRKWVREANLGAAAGDGEKRALFLGGGESVSVTAGGGIVADSIYYTDDCWERMDEDYLYGGHDIGMFDLKGGKMRRLDDEFEEVRFDPPPCWLVPRPAAELGFESIVEL